MPGRSRLSKRARRALWIAALALVATGGLAWLVRGWSRLVLEVAYASNLEFWPRGEQLERIAWLGLHGGARGAAAIVERLDAGDEIRDAALAALPRIVPRLGPSSRGSVVRAVLRRLAVDGRLASVRGEPLTAPVHDAVLALAAAEPAALPGLATRLGDRSPDVVRVATSALMGHARSRPEEIAAILSDAGAARAAAFFRSAGELRDGGSSLVPAARHVATRILDAGGDPAVRAVALAFVVLRTPEDDERASDLAPLVRAWLGDADPTVRAAAVRLAAHVGPGASALDLGEAFVDATAFLASDELPADGTTRSVSRLLAEIVDARASWAAPLSARRATPEIVGGVGCDSIVPTTEVRVDRREWTPLEVARLGLVLDRLRGPVRDAASRALAERAARLALDLGVGPSPIHADGLRIDEWIVWGEGIDRHDSAVRSARLLGTDRASPRVETHGVVRRSVIFEAHAPVAFSLRLASAFGESRGGVPAPSACAPSALEWRGLRVGWDASLEPAASAPFDAVRAAAARSAGGASIAIGDESGSFLACDAVAMLPSPLVATWASTMRRALLISSRPVDEYRAMRHSGEDRGEARVPLPSLWVIVRSWSGDVRGAELSLDDQRSSVEASLDALDLGEAELRARLAAALEREGLRASVASALLAAWETRWFDAPGRRVLAVPPRWFWDALAPCAVVPPPETLARAGVLWREGPSR